MSWTLEQMPDQTGQTVVITGANSGLGFETAKAFLDRGAHVILACRNREKTEQAIAKMGMTKGQASIVETDLSSQKSIKQATQDIKAMVEVIDIIVNNAGVMLLAQGLTEDGFERQIGTNHFGHFTFIAELLEKIKDVEGSRIVTVSSLAHRGFKLYFDDLTLEKNYGRQKAYSQSKLANLVFALHLDKLLKQNNCKTISVACHPGGSNTNLAENFGKETFLGWGKILDLFWPLFTQSAAQGALPSLYSATQAGLKGGEYIGPGGFFELTGKPKTAFIRGYAKKSAIQEELWQASEKLTDTEYKF